jgi:PPP family 3-phenylpropionic acid transporter
MTAQPVPDPVLTPELRTSAFYATLFMSVGALTVYGGIWLGERGLSDAQIGVVNAAPVLAMLVLNLVVGRIADRAADWRSVIVLAALGAGLFPVGLIWAEGFWAILVFWTLAAICQAATVPVIDAAATRLTARRGTDFGAMRAWGTIGYLVVLLGTGAMVGQAWGPAAFIWVVVALGLLRSAVALGLPRFRGAPVAARAGAAGRIGEVMRGWFILPLLGYALISATHLILSAFQGLLFARQGIGLEWIGVIIAAGALSETVMFFVFGRWFAGRFRLRSLILVASVISVARWLAMALEPGLGWLVALQALHGVTYGMGFMACVAFISKWTSEDIAAEAQGVFVVMQQGFSVVTLFGFGLLAERWGAQAYVGSAALAAVGTAMVWVSLRLRQPEG